MVESKESPKNKSRNYGIQNKTQKKKKHGTSTPKTTTNTSRTNSSLIYFFDEFHGRKDQTSPNNTNPTNIQGMLSSFKSCPIPFQSHGLFSWICLEKVQISFSQMVRFTLPDLLTANIFFQGGEYVLNLCGKYIIPKNEPMKIETSTPQD